MTQSTVTRRIYTHVSQTKVARRCQQLEDWIDKASSWSHFSWFFSFLRIGRAGMWTGESY